MGGGLVHVRVRFCHHPASGVPHQFGDGQVVHAVLQHPLGETMSQIIASESFHMLAGEPVDFRPAFLQFPLLLLAGRLQCGLVGEYFLRLKRGSGGIGIPNSFSFLIP